METIFINPKNNTKSATRVAGRNPQGSGTKTKKKKKSATTGTRLVNYFGGANSPVVRRTLNTFGTIVSGGTGLIPLGTKSADGVRSATSWGNISQEFENFRVRSMNMRFTPSTVNATSSTGPYQGMLMIGRWAQLVPAAQGNIEQKKDTVYHSTLEEFEIHANYVGIQELQEWVPVGTALSAAQNYGFAYMTPATTSVLAITSDVYSWRVSYEVEFKKAN
jgi:hypothetical protein